MYHAVPQHQLEGAIALAVVAAISLAGLWLSRRNTSQIQLPTTTDDHPASRDPFDVTTFEDTVDGAPVDPERFWTKMWSRKVATSTLLATIVIGQAIRVGLSAIDGTGWTNELVAGVLQVGFALYTFAVSLCSVRLSDKQHAMAMVHLSVLTLFATLVLFATAIIPEVSVSDGASIFYARPDVPTVLWYCVLVLYFVAGSIAVTTPRGPPLLYSPSDIYSHKTIANATASNDVSGETGASVLNTLLFSYTTKVAMLGYTSESLELGDLPILPAHYRGTVIFSKIRCAMRRWTVRVGAWRPTPGSGLALGYQLLCLNKGLVALITGIAVASGVLHNIPSLFLRWLVDYTEADPDRTDRAWGWVYCTGLLCSTIVLQLTTGQVASISTTIFQVPLRIQLNSILFAKTLVRKDVASSAPPKSAQQTEVPDAETRETEKEFSSKAQIMTLMTTDVDRVSQLAVNIFPLINSPVEIIVGTMILYSMMGVSCFFGLATICLFLPLNHLAGKSIVRAQENLMHVRDARTGLMNEILGAIRMLKFMAWERRFEAKVHELRQRELKYQRLSYHVQLFFNTIWSAAPILVTLVSFWHYAVIRGEPLTASVAFTSISVFQGIEYALNAFPDTVIEVLQALVSLRRIEKYLSAAEVNAVPPLQLQPKTITARSATITWPTLLSSSTPASPHDRQNSHHTFILEDVSFNFPVGELSLICGKLGSGKSLLLLALLGEADLLAGELMCPHSPPDAVATLGSLAICKEEWNVQGLCAYVPQSAWLQNASIRDNILFDLPYVKERYDQTLEACALVADLEILEDGDMSEIGERGVNLSGGQKARVSLARAIYSRAATIFLDDVLSAVDAMTARHLYYECLKGHLTRGRTVVLVSHHIQLCAPGASYIVALDNGHVQFTGDYNQFQSSHVIGTLVHDNRVEPLEKPTGSTIASTSPDTDTAKGYLRSDLDSSSTVVDAENTSLSSEVESKAKNEPRKLGEEEKRAVGRIHRSIWRSYLSAAGGLKFWSIFILAFVIAALSPVAENGWLRIWTTAANNSYHDNPLFYIIIYTAINLIGLILSTLRWVILYYGGLQASTALYEELLESILFTDLRFHDRISRGRLLNRFGKDFESIDSSLPNHFGNTVAYGLSVCITFATITVVGGAPFLLAVVALGSVYFNVGKVYGQTSRDMRRLESVTRSPLYSIYGDIISGVTVIRAFGASSKFMREMLRCVDTNANPSYWTWGVNRWLAARFNLLSSLFIGMTGFVAVLRPEITPSAAGFALAFAGTIRGDSLNFLRRFVGLEQSLVAVERVKEFSELQREPPEFIEPRLSASWPTNGSVQCKDLCIRYAPDLPNVLHHLNFEIKPGQKIGVLGRTGSGKSTLALSFFRFVEPAEGRILIDGIDISRIGLTDLRSKLTIIPQDPTILSGTVRSTLDVFDEYQDAEIYEALRRVRLLSSSQSPSENACAVNANIFQHLDSAVSESGENFSTGEKQLLCMARAILKRSKLLLMDEATASVDYATDELISKTIRQEFADSTIITIAHRLRTVIDYDKVMLLEQGRIVEFDTPATLLADPSSKFYALCKATGSEEFQMLRCIVGAQ